MLHLIPIGIKMTGAKRPSTKGVASNENNCRETCPLHCPLTASQSLRRTSNEADRPPAQRHHHRDFYQISHPDVGGLKYVIQIYQ